MDNEKIGRLLCRLRKERGLTQRELAEALHISDKTVSKWERGMGCPDVSLLGALSGALGVDVRALLAGELDPNEANGGNMKRIKFYVCPDCGNILTAAGAAQITCCGRTLEPLTPQRADEAHRLTVQSVEEDLYLTFPHEMRKDHFISFVACVTLDKALLVRLYPEQGSEARIPRLRGGGKLYHCCSRHGLFVED